MTHSLRSRSIRAAVLAAALATVAIGAQARSGIGWAVGAGVAVGLLAAAPTYVQAYPAYPAPYYPAPVYNIAPVQPVYQGQIYSPPLYSNMPPQVSYGSTYYEQPYVAPRPVYVQPPPVYYAPPAVYINNNRGYYNDRPYRGREWRNDGDRHYDHRR